MKKLLFLILTLLLAVACDSGDTSDNGRFPSSDADSDGDADSDADGDSDGDSPCDGILNVVVRDFEETHPDFYAQGSMTCWTTTLGLVQDTLDASHKPVFKDAKGTLQDSTKTCDDVNMLSNAANFNNWYNTESGINVEHNIQLTLTESETQPGFFTYENKEFFPIDNGTGHNYLFTTEIHTQFEYKAGQTFYFYGDDDVWIFVNNKLALDLGGIHTQQEGTIVMDNLGLTAGKQYRLDIFQAERQPTWSNFLINTSIGCFVPVID